MNQEDDYPPGGNGMGDACDCEGNFDCDIDCDGSDAASFKQDFARSDYTRPCTNEDPCKGDFTVIMIATVLTQHYSNQTLVVANSLILVQFVS